MKPVDLALSLADRGIYSTYAAAQVVVDCSPTAAPESNYGNDCEYECRVAGHVALL